MILRNYINKLLEVGFTLDDQIMIDGDMPIPFESVFSEIKRGKGFILLVPQLKEYKSQEVKSIRIDNVDCKILGKEKEWLSLITFRAKKTILAGSAIKVDGVVYTTVNIPKVDEELRTIIVDGLEGIVEDAG